MALNLSTLTSPATSGDVLAEALTTADFLEPCPVLKNLSRGSNKGGDAEQAVALNQPKALPLIDGKGYLYLSGVNGNYVSFPSANLTGEHEVIVKLHSSAGVNIAGHIYEDAYQVRSYGSYFRIQTTSGFVNLGVGNPNASISGTKWVKITYVPDNGTGNLEFAMYVSDNGSSWTSLGSGTLPSFTLVPPANTTISSSASYLVKGAIFEVIVKDGIDGTVVTDVDFTATNVRHGDTKFKCATGQTVTINQAGKDPATIIRKPVLRLDGVDDWYSGLFDSAIAGGRMFAAFTVLGNGGESSGRVFGTSTLVGADGGTDGAIMLSQRVLTGESIAYYEGGNKLTRAGGFSGTHIHEVLLSGSSHKYLLDGGSELTDSTPLSIAPERFSIGGNQSGITNSSIDLEYLALFPASITDAQADAVRKYINNRNNVFDLKDGFGYYFYNPQDLSSGAVASWNGRIVGSDNGDTDKFATQGTANDQPVGDGYVVTFADNTDHLDIPSTTQVGWQIVGTSLGTFAYRVNNNAVTELNLLGNLGSASYRQAGDLYGAILLPESATGADIQKARKLLIDRGAADGVTGSSLNSFWYGRGDIVEFRSVDTASVTNFSYAWRTCNSLTSFPLIDTSSGTTFNQTWFACTSLTSFPLIDTSSGTNFTQTWRDCNSLTSFPLIDTSSGANFTQTWYNCTSLTSFPLIDTSSGTIFNNTWQNCTSLTSFPLIDTSSGTIFNNAWQNCTSLTSFPLIDTSSGTNFTSAWLSSGLTSFSTPLPTATILSSAFRYCSSLSNLNLAEIPLVTHIDTAFQSNSITSFNTKLPKVEYAYAAWYSCAALTDFSADVFANWNPSSISSGVFNGTWKFCSLTAQSVENILTSIDASGHFATTNKLAGGTPLGDAGIDIDYNGDPLTAATTAAITSLKSKGWGIFINNVEQ
jgi:hypothetical protein